MDIQQDGEGLSVMSGAGISPAAPADKETVQFTGSSGGKVLTTPAVRKIAKENNVDLSQVPGTGPKGRVLKEDVLKYIKAPSKTPVQRATPVPVSAVPSRPAPVSSPTAAPVSCPSKSGEDSQDTVVPLRGVQRIMVKSMTEALKVPHLTYCEEVVMDSLMSVRKELKNMLHRSGNSSKVNVSFMPLIIKVGSTAITHLHAVSQVTPFYFTGDLTSSPGVPISECFCQRGGNSSDVPRRPQFRDRDGHPQGAHRACHQAGAAQERHWHCEGADRATGTLTQKFVIVIQANTAMCVLKELASKGALTEAHLKGGTFSLSNIGSF